MVVTARDRCAACGRPFRGSSRPRWCFDAAGLLLGRTHTSHRNRLRTVHSRSGDSQIAAQFSVWVYGIGPSPEGNTDAWYAQLLTHRITGEDWPSEHLNDEQGDLVRRWTVDGPLKLGVDREDGIRQAYAALVRGFLTWRASLCAAVVSS